MTSYRFWLNLGLFLGLGFAAQAQLDMESYVFSTPRNDDYVYRSHIRSVRFFPSDSEVDYPIVELNSPISLILQFDDLEADSKHFFYKIIHCNADWTPSENFDPIDYIDGFQENRIYESRTSFGTRMPYTHYDLELPNKDVRWTKSGNYLLKVFLDNDEDQLVLTRRFMVVERKMKAVPKMRRSATPPNAETHQELIFSIQHAGISVPNPAQELRVVILQNGRWDMAVFNPEPTRYNNNEIVYDWQGRLAFPGGREFRPLDLRSFRFRTNQVQRLDVQSDAVYVELFPDMIMANSPHVFIPDLNGKFIIQTHDMPDQKLQGEYGYVKFRLPMKTPLPDNQAIYILGWLNHFQPMPEYRMQYNPLEKAYIAELPLKNGHYDYQYAVFPRENPDQALPDIMPIEGSSYEAENDYLILVYHRAFGSRYEELVAVQKINTRPR